MRTSRPLIPRLLAIVAGLLVLPVLPGALAESTASPAVERSAPTGAHVDGQPVVERHAAGDMVVDWLEDPPADAAAWLGTDAEPEIPTAPAGGAPHAEGDHGFATEDATAAGASSGSTVSPGQGFAVFSASPRLLTSGYTVRLTGSDGRIEQYRDELARAAQGASAATGLPIRVAASRGGPVDPSRGEITVVLGDGPCGADAVGCGGPSSTATQLVAGRVWIRSVALGFTPTQRTNLAMHELGHALGLRHHGSSWVDGLQVMYPRVTDTTTYRAGDVAGLQFMAGVHDRRAGAVDAVRYAAGHVRVSGHLVSGTRVRVSVAGATKDVTAVKGRFAAAIPAAAGNHQVCAAALDAATGFRRPLGCTQLHASGRPFGRIDGVADSFETVRIRGWAADPQTAGAVQVEVRRNGVLVQTATADGMRADIASALPDYGAAHGFHVELPAVAGANELCVRVLGVGAGGHKDLGCRTVRHPVDPVGRYAVADVSDTGVTVSGWALDPNTPSAVTVVVTVDGLALHRFRAQDDHAEVVRSHPAHGRAHGFAEKVPLVPGDHEVCLDVVNVGLGSDRSLGCSAVHVRARVAGVVADVASTSPVALVDDLPVVAELTGEGGIISGVLAPLARG